MSKVLKRLYLGDVVKSFGTRQLRKLTTEIPQEDSIIGTWVFNDVLNYDSIDPSQNHTVYVDAYYVNSSGYVRVLEYIVPCNKNYYLEYKRTDQSFVVLPYTYNLADSPTKGWRDNDYKTITFNRDVDDIIFKSWLKANATKQVAPTTINFTINGTQFEAEPNMTWGEWLESAYNTSGYYTKTITSGGVEYNPIIIAENGDAFTVVEIKGSVMEIGNGISANGEYLSVTLTQDSDSIVGTWLLNEIVNPAENGEEITIDVTGTAYSYEVSDSISSKYINQIILNYDNANQPIRIVSTIYSGYNYATYYLVDENKWETTNGKGSYKSTFSSNTIRKLTITEEPNNAILAKWLNANGEKIS